MNSGCENCPAYAKCTVTYRGSSCAALRRSYGIGDDPKTNADRIRGMSDEELAELIYSFEDLKAPDYCQRKKECDDMLDSDIDIPAEKCIGCLLDWLRKEATR